MPSDSSVLMVVVMKDGALVGSEVFPPGTYRLGRADDMDLCLQDPRVSAHHASFLFVNGQIGIRDEGSQSGIFVNGEKVKSSRIQPRDEIEVAPYILKMRLVQKRKAGDEAPALARTALAAQEATAPGPLRPAMPAMGYEESGQADFAALQALEDGADPGALGGEEPTQLQPGAGLAQAVAAPQRVPTGPARTASRGDKGGLLQPRPIPRAVAAPAAAPAAQAPGAPLQNGVKDHPPFYTTVSVQRPKGLGVPIPIAPPQGAQPALRPMAAPLPPPSDTDLKTGTVSRRPVLRVQFLWGETLETATIAGARTFSPGEAVIAGASERAPLPVYGLPSPKSVKLASFKGGKWRIKVPDGVDLLVRDGSRYSPEAVPANGLFELGEQDGAVLRYERVAVELISELAGPRVGVSLKPDLERSYWIPMVAALCFMAGLIAYSATRPPIPDFKPQGLPPVRAILQAPKKKKVEPKVVDKTPEKKLPEKKLPEVVHNQPKPPKQLPVQQPAATAAVQKLLNPKVTAKLFSALNNIGAKGKLGNGMDYKATGLIGKLPLAMGGSGSSLGLGKGFGGGGVGGVGLAGLKTAGLLGAENRGRRGVVGAPVTIPRGGGKVQGELPMEAVRKVVDAHLSAIQRCYEGALIRNPSIAGKVTFEWTIGTDGNVKVVKTKVSTLPGSEVPDCIRGELVTWHFPAPKGGVVVVSYPFLFNSVGN